MQLCIKGLLQSQQKQSTSPIKVILSRSQTAAAFPSDLFVGGGTQKAADGIQFSAPESCNDGTMDAEAADHADQAHGCPYLLHPPTLICIIYIYRMFLHIAQAIYVQIPWDHMGWDLYHFVLVT